MADYFPNGSTQYYNKCKQQCNYIKTYLIDHVNGDWYEDGLDKESQKKTAL
jgi:mannobiose 2-epimerase